MEFNFEKPSKIRILPMDRKGEFGDLPIDKVQQDFFLKDLPYRKNNGKHGKYLFKEKGIDANPGCIVLFQYDNRIIASAKLTYAERFLEPEYRNNEKYSGAFYFEPSSITIFDPVTNNEMESIWPEFKVFSRVKQKLDMGKYPQFLQLINKKNPEYIAEKNKTYVRKYGGGGEGESHKNLKEWIVENPSFIGLENVKSCEIEHTFLSGDAVDILFKLSDGSDAVVEIETDNSLPGCHQAIKYRALRCAQRLIDINSKSVRAILVAWEIPKDVRIFCKKYNIEYFEKKITVISKFI